MKKANKKSGVPKHLSARSDVLRLKNNNVRTNYGFFMLKKWATVYEYFQPLY